MRNIVQYPVTLQEVTNALDEATVRYTDAGLWFGVEPYIFSQLVIWLSAHPEAVDEIFGVKVK